MYKFAHISDCHLGFQKSKNLQEIEQNVFESALDECIRRKVDFIIMSGDLFHVNLPEVRIQRFAFQQFKRLYDSEIPVYIVYGSHDYSPVSHSVIDLLTDVGYVTKVTQDVSDTQKIKLKVFEDKKTGAKITGLPGRTIGLEKKYYEELDRESLEKEEGIFKIFVFHSGIDELKSRDIPEMDSIPLSYLPKGFDYYAGGHIHRFLEDYFENYGKFVYPGTMFAGYHADLEDNARGIKRGFVLTEFDKGGIKSSEFVSIPNAQYEPVECEADGKTAGEAREELLKRLGQRDPKDKIIIIKVSGELSSGRPTEMDFGSIKQELFERGAIEVLINHNKLASKEYEIVTARGSSKEEIEKNVIKENIGQFKLGYGEIEESNGEKLAYQLMHNLRTEKQAKEKDTEYKHRMLEDASKLFGVELSQDRDAEHAGSTSVNRTKTARGQQGISQKTSRGRKAA